jgi:hypothetical protein
MLTSLLIAPSMNGLILTGLFMLIIFMIFIKNYNNFLKLNYYQQIVILSLLSLVIGIHSLIHLAAEKVYGFNPYKWFY